MSGPEIGSGQLKRNLNHSMKVIEKLSVDALRAYDPPLRWIDGGRIVSFLCP